MGVQGKRKMHEKYGYLGKNKGAVYVGLTS